MSLTFKHNQPLQAALRAGIAVCIAIACVAFFHLEFGFWLILTTIVVLQPTFGATLQRSKSRAIGTLLGVAIGALLAAIIKQSLIPTIIILAALILMCVIAIKISQSVAIFFATTIVMLLLAYQQPNNWEFVTLRVYDTIIGAGIGILASILLWPNWAKSELNYNLYQTIGKADELLLLILNAVKTSNADIASINPLKLELEQMVDKNRQFMQQTMQEMSLAHHQLAPALALVENLEKLQYILQTFHFISTADFKPKNPERLKAVLQTFQQDIHDALVYAQKVIRYSDQPFVRQQRNQLFDRIKLLDELPQDRTPELRFLHRNMNLLIVVTNHLLHSALLMVKPKMIDNVHDQDRQQQQHDQGPDSQHIE